MRWHRLEARKEARSLPAGQALKAVPEAGEIWGILAQPVLRALKAACGAGLLPLIRQVLKVVLEAGELLALPV
jgi:hypothetical protein